MGILEGMVAGAGEALQNIGLQGVAAAIQAERDARLSEIRLGEEATIRQRGKDDAAAERSRVETEAKAIAEKRGGLIAERQGLDDPANIGADENPGYSVQKGQIEPTSRDRMQAQGKHAELAQLEEKDADNIRNDKKQKSDDEKWHVTAAHQADVFKETVRHNKALEANANYGRIPPAAKAQLELESTAVTSAHKAESEAAKALEAGRKDTLASPEKIRQLETEYQASKTAVANALKRYDSIGSAHFGDQWKKASEAAPAVADNGALQKAHADAKAALATGRITLEEINKRLASKGLAPLPSDEKKTETAGGGGLINGPSGANNPEANIYGTADARERRREELERIIGDNGYTRDERQAAERELAAMKK